MTNAPKPTLNLPCKILHDEDIYDGDTLTVQVTINFRVRLLDCWAHEVRTRDLEAKRLGIASRDYLRSFVDDGAAGVLVIPLGGATRFDDMFTMGRILGRVNVNGVDLSDHMVEQGHAWKTKQELQDARGN